MVEIPDSERDIIDILGSSIKTDSTERKKCWMGRRIG